MAAVREVLPRGKYTLGPQVAAFEDEFARFCGVTYGVGISNGTEALHLALLACGVGPGDDVITVPNTYAATVFAISYVGATPIYVDVDPRTFNLVPAALEAALTARTRHHPGPHVRPARGYGSYPGGGPAARIACDRGRFPCAWRHVSWPAGSLSDVACFSFYPSKNLGAFGDAGAAVTADEALHYTLRQLRYMGQKVKHEHEIVGHQQRLDELQAAILRVKLRHLPAWNARRRYLAGLYDELLAPTPATVPYLRPGVEHVYYMYTIRAPRRDDLKRHLEQRGVGTQVIYPKLVPQQKAYQGDAYRPGTFPHAESVTPEILSLPIFPELTDEEVAYIAACVAEFYA